MRQEKEYNHNIDFVKGILILLVAAGHLITGNLNETFSRYIIYAFHMPLFIGIAGYLLSVEKLKAMSLAGIFRRYWIPIIVPWLFAVHIYFVIVNFHMLRAGNLSEILDQYRLALLHPYYHLWFVLGFLSYIILTWLVLKCGFPFWILMLTAVGVSFFSEFFDFRFANENTERVFKYIQYDFRLYNYIYFVIGILFRMKTKAVTDWFKNKKTALWLCTILTGAVVIFSYWTNFAVWESLVSFAFNILLLIVTLLLCSGRRLPRGRFLEYLGRSSYAIYLWHMLGILAVKLTIGMDHMLLYYVAGIAGIAAVIGMIRYLSRYSVINKYFLGNVK